MSKNLIDVINEKYGNQAKCAKAIGWTRQQLNKIVLKKREARVNEINTLANALDISVSDVVFFLTS